VDIAVKDGASTTDGLSAVSHTQILGKLSNTVSSDYVIGAEDVLLTKRLREYVQNPVVAISEREVNSYSIFLLAKW